MVEINKYNTYAFGMLQPRSRKLVITRLQHLCYPSKHNYILEKAYCKGKV